MEEGKRMYKMASLLWPICRSLTGNGVRKSLHIIKDEIPDMNIFEVKTGSKVFDWEIPKEWNVRDAYIKDSQGNRLVDFKDNNLHLVGYSLPINKFVRLDELNNYLFTLPEQPELIPYVTSYYKEMSGFCISENMRKSLKDDIYHIVIDSDLSNGSLTYGEIIIPGHSKEEIFLSTYICHPSMANNEISGPVVVTELVRWIKSIKNRRYTYRIVFIPETIGAITYLSKNIDVMKENIVAGFNITCVGDSRTYSYIESRYGNTLADKVAKNTLKFHYPNYKRYSFLDRGSDERQYCAPGVDLPVCSICRSKYGEYPEYHTSADNLSLISSNGLQGAFDVYKKCINTLENNYIYKVNFLCEPQLGKRNLYPSISKKGSGLEVRDMMNFIAYADGKNDLIDISNIINVPCEDLISIANKLVSNKILRRII